MSSESPGVFASRQVTARRRTACRILCLALSCAIICPAPAFCAPAQAEKGRLSHYEQIVFGKASGSQPTTERLGALETSVFGKPQPGSVTGRLDAIGKQLGGAGAPPSAEPEQRKQGHVDVSVADSAEINGLLGQGLKQYGAGDLNGAEYTFQQVLGRDPRNSNALYNLAAIDERRGYLEAALQKYEIALSFTPDDQELRRTVDSVRQELSRRHSLQAQIDADRAYQASIRQNQYNQVPVTQVPPATAPVTRRPPPTVSVNEPSRNRSGISTAAKTAAMLGIVVGIGALAGRGGMGGLHCPMCRIMRGGF